MEAIDDTFRGAGSNYPIISEKPWMSDAGSMPVPHLRTHGGQRWPGQTFLLIW